MDARKLDFHIIIPARYDSKRLPGKLLLDVAGKPLLQRVYEQGVSYGAKSVTIATDSEIIKDLAINIGADYCLTGKQHQTGTDRIAEAVVKLGLPDDAIVVNLQGDEPLIPGSAINLLVATLGDRELESSKSSATSCSVATLAMPITDYQEIIDPNVVKVVFDKKQRALIFSRAPLPWVRDEDISKLKENNLQGFHRHIGLYGYRVEVLMRYASWQMPIIEKLERLEQLRFLWHGEGVRLAIVKHAFLPGVDTKEDLQRVAEHFA